MEVLDYDPVTKITTNYAWDNSRNGFTLQTVQDGDVVQAIVDAARERRNDTSIKQKGIKAGWMHACIVPDGVMAKMFKPPYSFNPYHKANGKKLLKVIQRDFPYLMTATGRYA